MLRVFLAHPLAFLRRILDNCLRWPQRNGLTFLNSRCLM
jgi:hypothetical protein